MPERPDVDLQPDTLDVLQAEEYGPEPPVTVIVDEIRGPVRVQELPRKSAATRTRQVTTTPMQVLRADHRRASALVVADGAVRVAFSGAAAQDASTMAAWPANLPIPLTADTELWVGAQTGTANVSMIMEFWATGK